MLDSELDELLNDTPSSPRNEDGHKRKSLGRGLEALMGAFDEETSIGNLDNKNTNLVDINVIIPHASNPTIIASTKIKINNALVFLFKFNLFIPNRITGSNNKYKTKAITNGI